MPGFIMHMAESNLILNEIGNDKSEEWKRLFIAGSLLPDTKKRGKKLGSHFWDIHTIEDMAIAPRLDYFLKMYEKNLENPLVLGYYAHLHLDERFVNRYWPEQLVAFLDDEGRIKTKRKDITKVKILRTGQLVSRDTFFSDEYYYGDYTRLNDYFIEKYNIDLSFDYMDIPDCPIKEVRKEDLAEVIQQLELIGRTCKRSKGEEIKVFSRQGICEFLEETSKEFIKIIGK